MVVCDSSPTERTKFVTLIAIFAARDFYFANLFAYNMNNTIRCSVYLIVCILFAFVAANEIVNINGLGKVRGHFISDKTIEFLGIPYAEPPVGDRRLRPSEPVQPWKGTLEATRGVICPQHPPRFTPPHLERSEDCLVVNIWTPTNATPKSKLPVLVFIHGGAFYVGSGLDNYANPHNLTQNDVIFVNINYRLGYLGFLAHPALTRENPSKPCNFGLLDQRVALDWVSKHIGAFGGDSNNITMMGESAGAVSVMAHLAAVDVYNPPVSKAVVMSSIPWFTRANLSHAEELGIDMVKRFGCSQETDEELLKCLRSLPTEEFLIMASLRLVFFWHLSTGPALIHDGINFKEPNVGSFMEGNFKHDIPLMIGTTADEGNLFVFLSFILHKPTEDIYKSLVEKAFGRFSETVPGVVNEIFERYSLSSPKYATYPAFYALGDIISDVSFTCPSQQMLKSAHSFSSSKHANGHKNVYGYLWNYNHDPSDVMRAYHGSELPYFFGGGDRTQPDSVKLGNHIFPYLLQFVRTGSPSVPNLPEWPSFGDEHNVLVLQPNVTVQTHFKDEICQWWHTNFPKGMPMSTDDLLADEPFLSMFFNKYVLYAIITFNRKPRLAYSVTGVVLLLFGLILYKIVKAICCRSKKPVATKQKKQQ